MKNAKIFVLFFALMLLTAFTLSSCDLLESKDEQPPTDNGDEHILVKVDAKEATCTTDGNEEYYTCTGCDLLFADAEGRTIIDAPVVIHGKHTTEIIPGVEGDCFNDGYSASRVCTVCNEIITPSEPVEAGHKVNPKADFWGFSLKNIDGRAYVVVYGGNASSKCERCGEDMPLKVAMDFQHNNNIDGLGWSTVKAFADNNNLKDSVGESTVEAPAVEAVKLENGLFEARFDVTEFQAGWTLLIHMGLDGNMVDANNYGSGDGAAVYADGKKFSYIRNKNTTWNIISLNVTEANENEYNLNGRMTLEEIDGAAHIVYNGSWNSKNGDADKVKEAIAAEYFDIQQFENGWKVVKPTPIIEANEDGSLKVALSLDGLAPGGTENPYYMHRGDSSTNVTLPNDMHYSLTVGNYTYKTHKGSSLASWMSSLTVIFIIENEAEG